MAGVRWLLGGVLVTALLFEMGTAAAERTYSVKISSEPGGAKVYIDDPDSEPIGETPYTGDLAAGTYTIVIERTGFETGIESITVKKSRRRQSFAFELVKKPTAFLKLQPPAGEDFEDTTVLVDDAEVEVEPNVKFEVTVGPHKVEVVREGFETFESYVEVEEGELRGVSVNFVPEGEGKGGDDVVVKKKKKKKKDGPKGPPAKVDLLSAWGGFEWGGRDFKYDAESMNLRDYKFLGARFRIGATVHPLVSFGKWAGGLGIGVNVGLLLGPKTSTNDAGTPDDTSDDLNANNGWTDYSFDARYRLDFAEQYWAAAALGYGKNTFAFTDVDAGLEGDLAATDYKLLQYRLLGGARFADIYDAYVGINLYQVLEAGEVRDRFTAAAVSAFGIEFGGRMAIYEPLDLTVRLVYDRFSYKFGDPVMDATYDASSAVDQLFGLTFGVGYRM